MYPNTFALFSTTSEDARARTYKKYLAKILQIINSLLFNVVKQHNYCVRLQKDRFTYWSQETTEVEFVLHFVV